MIKGIKIRKKEMLDACNQGNLMATDLAEWFVSNLKISFRLAYKITTKIIKVAEKNNCQINNLKVEQLNFIDSNFRQKIKEFLKLENSVKCKTSFGGTAPQEIKTAIQKAKKDLN